MKKVFVVGLGLIGASLAKNIKTFQENCLVYGFDQDSYAMDYAVNNHIIDDYFSQFEEGVHWANIIILATPITNTVEYMKQMDQFSLKEEKVVMDVGSVKHAIMEVAGQLNNNKIAFIGGHPMAGSHKQGVEAAKAHLFENAYFILIPSKSSTGDHVNTIQSILSGTKSHFVQLTVEEHDKMTGIVSHFPHLVASSLVHQAIHWQKEYPFIPKLAAGGFRDITRIASSSPKLWQDIFFQNKREMISFISEWIEEMEKVKDYLENNKKEEILTYLKEAKMYRDGLPKKEKGAIPSFYDLYVDIYDKPGELYKVIKLFASHEINIINIQILEIREDMTGVLQLTVQSKEAQLTGKALLENYHYEVTIEE